MPLHPPVPDLDNRRFCRACEAALPVELFPPGKRRYLCRRHTWLRVKRPSKERALADPRKKLLWVLWRRCWNDARTVFGQPRIALRQCDIAQVLSGLDFGGVGGVGGLSGLGEGVSSGELLDRAEDSAEKAAPAIALLPENPAQLLSRENFVVVATDARRDMLRAYRDGGVERYAEALGRLD